MTLSDPAETLFERTQNTPQGAVQSHTLSLPDIHCAGCISKIEKALMASDDVQDARVNLSLRRVSVKTTPNTPTALLISLIASLGFEALELDKSLLSETDSDAKGRGLLIRIGVSGFAAMNVMILSVAVWSGAQDSTRDFMHWVSAAIALPTIAFAAQPFFNQALTALKVRRLNMDVPISLAIILASAMSLYETTQGGQHAYFDAALSLTFFLLAGRYLDHRTRASARSAAQELAALEVKRVKRLEGGKVVTIPLAQLNIGDTITLAPGDRIPTDGIIATGTSDIDCAFLTGESQPFLAKPNTIVHAGEVNLTGPLTITATALAKDSALQQLADLVAVAEGARTKYTSLADRAAAIYAPGVHVLAALAFVGWMIISGDLRLSTNIAIAVLIITCPCALGLAVPAVTTAASGRLFAQGVLLKSSTALERLAEIDTVIFDKTGTLTLGTPMLSNGATVAPTDIALAAALSKHSNHPMARAIGTMAQSMALPIPTITEVTEVPGYGIKALYKGEPIRLGRASWVAVENATTSSSYLKRSDDAPIVFEFEDSLRPGAKAVVAGLLADGIKVYMLSGDTTGAVAQVAKTLGITSFHAESDPKQKIDRISKLQSKGQKILMVGDGLNDTGALRTSDVSMSPASAIDAARVASDIVLLKADLAGLSECLHIGRSARRRIQENFTIAVVYNVVAVPVALLGFATPLIAALAMSFSSITVTLNAWRVRLK